MLLGGRGWSYTKNHESQWTEGLNIWKAKNDGTMPETFQGNDFQLKIAHPDKAAIEGKGRLKNLPLKT